MLKMMMKIVMARKVAVMRNKSDDLTQRTALTTEGITEGITEGTTERKQQW
jgi:hypothetical protein